MARTSDLIVRTKLILPRLRRHLLPRPELSSRLLKARHYALTLVQASTGYGKSTALIAALQEGPFDLFWYSITETDRDPFLFLLHLIYAFRLQLPNLGQKALALLEEAGPAPHPRQKIVDLLSNELVEHFTAEAVLVLDDYHLVSSSRPVNELVDRFLDVLPPNLHLVLSTRHRPPLKSLVPLRVKGDLLEIDQQAFAFSAKEIDALFGTQYGFKLNHQQVGRLLTETEGWVIALRMIWQSLHDGVFENVDQVLDELPRSLEDLFVYLAQDVLSQRPPRIQDFLLRTSVLRHLDPAACDNLLEWEGSGAILKELDEEGFFLVRMGDAYRYHHLFHDFLRQEAKANSQQVQVLHSRAARFFRAQGDLEESVYHWLAASEFQTAAEIMAQISRSLVDGGRIDTLSEWVTTLPPHILADFPDLMINLGDLCRYASRFDEALAWYEQAQERSLAAKDVAGASRALRAQAAVFLDTVRPIRAESLLQEALRLVDGQPDREEHARLLDLMAENMTNRGRWEEADSLRHQARDLREEGPGLADLDVRVLLRTGCLDQAQKLLAERSETESKSPQDHFRAPRAHRETLLLLSLIYSWQGKADLAFSTAHKGIEIGSQLGSPFVEAVGYMRLGHAWQITGHPQAAERALACYEQAMEIGQRLAVARTRVEALWGLCRLFGYQGELDKAERSAHEGIEAGLKAGDEWIAALIGVTLGASYAIANQTEAAERWLNRSAIAYRDLGDPFGQTVAVLWQTLFHRKNHPDDSEGFHHYIDQLLNLVQTNNYQFLFGRKTFLGPPDLQVLVSLLLAAGRHRYHHELITRILKERNLAPGLSFYPGYTLNVFTLGRFAVFRGQAAVRDSDWPREKARQLFQLLLSKRRFLERGVIISHLWPEADRTAGERYFRVTLNALHRTLEPGRPPRAPTLFVRRRGSAYGIDPNAPLTLDAADFESLIDKGAKAEMEELALESYRHALALYQGDFLAECRYADYCREERERLQQIFLTATTRIGDILLAQGTLAATEEVINRSERALAIDNCWEPAYQHLIRAYLHRDDHVQVHRVYERCVICLRQELDVSPMAATVALFESIHGR